MFDTFPVVVPALGQRLPGVLRPVESARAGILLLEGTGAQTALVPRLFAELELYFQAADFVTVRLSIPLDAKLSSRVSVVLGGVSLLRSMGASQVLVITSAASPLASWEQARAGTLAEFMELSDQGRELPDIVGIVRDLTTTIREVADSTIGVATLVMPTQTPEGAARHEQEKHTRRRSFAPVYDAGTTRSSPQALLLTLPTPENRDATRRDVAFLLTRLYSWALALIPPVPAQDSVSAHHVPDEASSVVPPAVRWSVRRAERLGDTRSAWLERMRWADEQWADLLCRFAERAPDRANRVREALSSSHDQAPGSSVRAARTVWLQLDTPARRAWLQVCSALFACEAG